jgi:two-component system, OmpR family, response regulator
MYNQTFLREGLRVLVVDGDADSRELLMVLFEQYGIETLTATCVKDSLEIMQKTCPDLLISEIALPEEDGYSLISQVKSFEQASSVRIPVIALTACVQERDRTQALAAGFCQHLAKPFDIDTLIATVACVTGQAVM